MAILYMSATWRLTSCSFKHQITGWGPGAAVNLIVMVWPKDAKMMEAFFFVKIASW